MKIVARLLVLVVAACGGAVSPASPSPSPKFATVTVEEFAFVPAVLEIEAGTTVTWVNRDRHLHTATFSPTEATPRKPDGTYDVEHALFNITLLENGGSGSFSFTTPGTYNYFCLPHDFIKAKVVVK